MLSPAPLDVVLPEPVALALAKIVGPTGEKWREAMGRGDEPLAVQPAEGGPFLVGRVVRLDPRLYRAATSALLALGHAVGKQKALAPVLDALVDAMAKRIGEDSTFNRR